jgi:hypothetical protein
MINIAYLSSWNIACGIAVYTKHLVDALGIKGYKAVGYRNTLQPKDVVKLVQRDRINLLHVQYEQALFPSRSNLNSILQWCKTNKIATVLTPHSEQDTIKQFEPFVDAFVFHKPSQFLTGDNVKLLPMAVPVYEPSETKANLRTKYSLPIDSKILATTGFAFNWKMYSEILGLMAPYLRSRKNTRVQLCISNSDFAPKETQYNLAKCKQLIESHKLQDYVWLNPGGRFLPQQELNDRLYLSDLGYLWGGLTTSSSSAAAKEFISSRLPVITTDSSHYHDLHPLAIEVTNKDPNNFVQRVFANLDNKDLLQQTQYKMEEAYDRLNYSTMISNLVSIYMEVVARYLK